MAAATSREVRGEGGQLRLRLSMIDGPELRCPHCAEWWPITFEFWEKNEWHMCLSCKRERARLYARLRQRDAEYRTKKAEASRKYRAWLAATCPEYISAYDRERKARNRASAALRRKMLREASTALGEDP